MAQKDKPKSNNSYYQMCKDGLCYLFSGATEKLLSVKNFLLLGIKSIPKFIKLFKALLQKEDVPSSLKALLNFCILLIAFFLGVKVYLSWGYIFAILCIFLPVLIPLGGNPLIEVPTAAALAYYLASPICLLLALFVCCIGLSASIEFMESNFIENFFEENFSKDEILEVNGLYKSMTSTFGDSWNTVEKNFKNFSKREYIQEDISKNSIQVVINNIEKKCQEEISKGENSNYIKLINWKPGNGTKTTLAVITGAVAGSAAPALVASTFTTSALSATLASWGLISGATIAVGGATMTALTIGTPIAFAALGFYGSKKVINLLFSEDNKENNPEKEKFLKFLVKIGIYMAQADGKLHEKEKEYIENLISEVKINEEYKKELKIAIEKKSELKDIICDSPGQEYSIAGLMFAWQIALADQEISPLEILAHDELAKGLGIDMEIVNKIRNQFEVFFQVAKDYPAFMQAIEDKNEKMYLT